MTITNQAGLTAFSRDFHTMQEGQPWDSDFKARPYRNPYLAQLSTISIAGFGADADSIAVNVTLPGGAVITETVTRASSVPVDDAAAAVAMAALLNARAELSGHLVATTDGDDLILTFDHENVVYPVTTTVVACTGTVVETVSAGGSTVPYGRFIAAGAAVGGQSALRALVATDRTAQIRAVTARPQIGVNLGSALATAVDEIAAGDIGAGLYEGPVAMRNNGSVAAAEGGTVYAVVATTGGDEIGEARSDPSGGTQVATITVVADHQNYAVNFGIGGVDYQFSYAPTDGTTSTADAIDGLEDSALQTITDRGIAALVTASTASATATMTLTAAAGYEFDYVDVTSFGEDVEATSGTVVVAATAVYAAPLDSSRFYWAEAVAAGAVGPVMCRA